MRKRKNDSNIMNRSLKGSSTIEASLLAPVLLTVLFLLIYLSLFLYARAGSVRLGYIAALRASQMEQETKNTRKAAAKKEFENLKREVERVLQEAVLAGADPKGEVGKRAMMLHKEWLSMTWKQYTENAHKGVAQMYVLDDRFRRYYDKEVEGCAAFLRDAILHWVGRI